MVKQRSLNYKTNPINPADFPMTSLGRSTPTAAMLERAPVR